MRAQRALDRARCKLPRGVERKKGPTLAQTPGEDGVPDGDRGYPCATMRLLVGKSAGPWPTAA
jgi:hypothetical protein